MTATDVELRLLTPEEIARVVKVLRVQHRWSQETLAELGGLTVRTVQRLEAGQPSSVDTQRAIARAFQADDLDWLNKPMPIPSEAQLRAQQEVFERNYLVLDAYMVDGRGLMAVFLDHGCDSLGATGLADLPIGVREAFAAILDFVRDCIDVADVASRTEMLGYGDTINEMAEPLREAGLGLAVASRKTTIVGKKWADQTPLPVAVVYLAAVPNGASPSKLVVPRQIRMG